MGFVITFDGPAGAGKSSVARHLAKRLNFRYLDTGALYRAVAYIMDSKGIAPEEGTQLSECLKTLSVRIEETGVLVDGYNVTDKIRSARVDSVVSFYSALESVRSALLDLQRDQANYGNLVADGRDTGTVVFPKADIKFFLTATAEARAKRRYKELLKKGEAVLYEEILTKMRERDRIDSSRRVAPLKEPIDSLHIDTSYMTESEVVEQLTLMVRGRMS